MKTVWKVAGGVVLTVLAVYGAFVIGVLAIALMASSGGK